MKFAQSPQKPLPYSDLCGITFRCLTRVSLHSSLSLMVFVFQMLEYNGQGASILDVGLAQAKKPLDTTSHYFEVEIIDPGENCFIAIGLTEKVFKPFSLLKKCCCFRLRWIWGGYKNMKNLCACLLEKCYSKTFLSVLTWCSQFNNLQLKRTKFVHLNLLEGNVMYKLIIVRHWSENCLFWKYI